MDSFFGIGIFELFLIAVIALVVLGPERLPGAMRTVAGYFRQIREVSSEFTSQFSEEIKMLEEMDPRRMINDALDPEQDAHILDQHGQTGGEAGARQACHNQQRGQECCCGRRGGQECRAAAEQRREHHAAAQARR